MESSFQNLPRFSEMMVSYIFLYLSVLKEYFFLNLLTKLKKKKKKQTNYVKINN